MAVVVGTAWALVMAWVHLVMTGFTESILPLPVTFLRLFGGPAVLIIGSALVMAMWHSRLGSVLILAACVWLTVLLGTDCLRGLHQEPLQAPPPYGVLISTLAVIAVTDLAVLILLRRVAKRLSTSNH